MMKTKNTKLFGLLLVSSLMILPFFLAACGSSADARETPFGLRAEAVETSPETGLDDTSDSAGPAVIEAADTAAAVVSEVQAPAANGGNGNSNQARIADRSQHVFDPETEPGLSPEEAAGLTYMREEEKLARDVYLTLYKAWGPPVFQNIAGSEEAHMNSVLLLLDQYGLPDPVAEKGVGEFADPEFQELYGQLTAQGRLSLAEALKVGAQIEELDIVDLQQRLAQTDNEYIVQVYSNLLKGSENHLGAFVSNLERQTGEVYQPVYLDQDNYQAIISSAARGGGNGNGNGYGGGNGQGGNRGGNGSNGGNGRGNGQNSTT